MKKLFHGMLANPKTRAASLSACLLALAVQPIQAASAWSPATQLSGLNALINLQFDGSIALDPFGNSVAVWDANGVIEAASQAAGGAYSAAVDISQLVNDETVAQPRVAMSPLGSAIAVWTSSVGNRRTGVVNYIKAATKRPNGTWSAPTPIIASSITGPVFVDPRIAVDAFGNAVAIWTSCDRVTATTCVVQSSSKLLGRPWSAVVNLSAVSGNASEPQLALSPVGIAVAVWKEFSQPGVSVVQAASKRQGRTWGTAVNVSQPDANFRPKVAVDAVGRATVVWNQGSVINAATRTTDDIWSTPVTISTNGSQASNAADVGMDLFGNATAAWTEPDPVNGGDFVQVATHRLGGAWTVPNPVSTVDDAPTEPRVAVNPGGLLKVVTWVDNNQNNARATTQLGKTAWSTPATLGQGLYSTSVEVTATVGGKARALWAYPFFSPGGGEGWAPAVSSFTP